MTHVVAISDLHGNLPEIPECDLLLIAGDVTPVWNHERKFQADWLRNDFSQWLMNAPARAIVGVGGNHDFVLEDSKKIGSELPWVYLNNESVTLGQFHDDENPLTIWGSPLSNMFGNWAFMKWEEELVAEWMNIPRDIDILITHGPAYGYGDRVPDHYAHDRDPHVGSTSLTYQLENDEWPNLKLHVFGHIHNGYGSYVGPTLMVNAAHVNEEYKPVNAPVELEL
jgi:Icc-related predicted phosphoesterase